MAQPFQGCIFAIGGNLMNKLIPAAFFGLILAASASAQNQQQPSFTSFLKSLYMGNRNEISRSAAKFPEEFYAMRPGRQMEVRTFGQLVGHLANFNYLWCSQAKHEKNPAEEKDFRILRRARQRLLARADEVIDTIVAETG